MPSKPILEYKALNYIEPPAFICKFHTPQNPKSLNPNPKTQPAPLTSPASRVPSSARSWACTPRRMKNGFRLAPHLKESAPQPSKSERSLNTLAVDPSFLTGLSISIRLVMICVGGKQRSPPGSQPQCILSKSIQPQSPKPLTLNL